jgi:hypothetical protein
MAFGDEAIATGGCDLDIFACIRRPWTNVRFRDQHKTAKATGMGAKQPALRGAERPLQGSADRWSDAWVGSNPAVVRR